MKIAVMGHGVVGSGTVEVFYKSKAAAERKTGKELDIKYILDLRDFPDSPYADKFIKDFSLIINDPEVGIVVEVMGGMKPAYEYTAACLRAGKSVVTSNKELVAQKGAELLALAAEHNVNYFFEASVGGGIPIIRPLHQCLAANEINEIAGILNGTTNFILTKMFREQMSFSDALALAQKLGYAEKDPTADVEGHDACRKICILASLAYGVHVFPDAVHTEGITTLTSEDVEYAENWGGVIKLIGRVKRLESGKLAAMVSPAFIADSSQLSSVDDVYNGILVRGDATGDVIFYGRGAGKLPTASAVVADIIDVAKANGTSHSLTWIDTGEKLVVDYREVPASLYVRLSGSSRDSVLAAAKAVFDGVESSLLTRRHCPDTELAFVTTTCPECELAEKLTQLEQRGVKVLAKVRVLDY